MSEEQAIEELQYGLADLAVYCIAIAIPAMENCVRHATPPETQPFDQMVHYFREHAVECLNAKASAIDKLRLALGSIVEDPPLHSHRGCQTNHNQPPNPPQQQ